MLIHWLRWSTWACCWLLPALAWGQALPGSVIAASSPATQRYLGSPSLVVMPDGSYLTSYNEFGPGAPKVPTGYLMQSVDGGQTWTQIARLKGAKWSNLFLHRDALYLMGTDQIYGRLVIRRSQDGGHSWTEPADRQQGLLRDDFEYHTAPMPMLIHQGRIFRAVEVRNPPKKWGVNLQALVISAPVDSDLLLASSWQTSNRLAFDPAWPVGNAWLEGNMVCSPEGTLHNLLRVNEKPYGGRAARIDVSADGQQISFDPETGFLHFPGGCKKFTIRYDSTSQRYWTLTNFNRDIGHNPERTRNCLSLVSSPDLNTWTVHHHVMYHPDYIGHGFQYADWQFEGEDLVAAVRCALDDGQEAAKNCHDANYLLFKRIENFRQYQQQVIVTFQN